jgi:hypothetical protein
VPPTGLENVSAVSLTPRSMPASFKVLRPPPQSPVNLFRSKTRSSAAAGLPGGPHEDGEKHQRAEAGWHEPYAGNSARGRQVDKRPLSRVVSAALLGVDRAMRSRRAEEILGSARHRRGKITIVRTALDDRLLFDEGLILTTEIKPCLDRDRTARRRSVHGLAAREAAHLSSGIRVQFEALLDPIGRNVVACCSLEPPVG